jgi:elongation of very long chain fatty acids protein 7
MNSTFSQYLRLYEDLKIKYSDPRTSDWFMMSSPIPSLAISLAYVVFVLITPRIMKNREAFKLKEIMLVYNFAMVILSSYLFYEFLASGWLMDYSLSCQPVDYSRSPKAMRVSEKA